MQNWPSCAELTKQHRKCKILQILFSNIALTLALIAATAKHFSVEVIKYFIVLCINAAVTGVTISNCNKFSHYMHSVTSVVTAGPKVAEVDKLELTSPFTNYAIAEKFIGFSLKTMFIQLAMCRKPHQEVFLKTQKCTHYKTRSSATAQKTAVGHCV